MKTPSLTFAELRDHLKQREGNRAGKYPLIRQTATVPAASIDPGKRILRFIASDESWDRCDTVIRADGWDLQHFRDNPVFLWCHDHEGMPLGQAVGIEAGNKRLQLDIQFATRDEYDFADTAYRMYLGRYLRANSVGFDPKDWEPIEKDGAVTGFVFTKQELWEDSACPVPANPNALMLAIRAGDLSREDVAQFTARVVYDGMLDSPDAREALSESVHRLMDLPNFEHETLLALRSIGATRPARTRTAQQATVAKSDWAAPLAELRAMNQQITRDQ